MNFGTTAGNRIKPAQAENARRLLAQEAPPATSFWVVLVPIGVCALSYLLALSVGLDVLAAVLASVATGAVTASFLALGLALGMARRVQHLEVVLLHAEQKEAPSNDASREAGLNIAPQAPAIRN
jgi:protein-S-isoprenylcysteine O-methyltransferase Ste14